MPIIEVYKIFIETIMNDQDEHQKTTITFMDKNDIPIHKQSIGDDIEDEFKILLYAHETCGSGRSMHNIICDRIFQLMNTIFGDFNNERETMEVTPTIHTYFYRA